MGVIIGIDVGGSTTKIVGFDKSGELIAPIAVKAADPITSIYGAFGKFTDTNSLELSQIEKVLVTGVGSSYLNKSLYGLECRHVSEFDCIGLGGLYLSGLSEAIVVSMGTGTAIVRATERQKVEYLGGTGIGGGTLVGLSKKLTGVTDINSIAELASKGDISKVDLRVSDITRNDIPGMSSDLTAANFGNLNDLATNSDLALGLLNMIFESVAMLSIFAARSKNINGIVLTGNITTFPQAKLVFDQLSKTFSTNFIIPKNSEFATVIGAALTEVHKLPI